MQSEFGGRGSIRGGERRFLGDASSPSGLLLARCSSASVQEASLPVSVRVSQPLLSFYIPRGHFCIQVPWAGGQGCGARLGGAGEELAGAPLGRWEVAFAWKSGQRPRRFPGVRTAARPSAGGGRWPAAALRQGPLRGTHAPGVAALEGAPLEQQQCFHQAGTL